MRTQKDSKLRRNKVVPHDLVYVKSYVAFSVDVGEITLIVDESNPALLDTILDSIWVMVIKEPDGTNKTHWLVIDNVLLLAKTGQVVGCFNLIDKPEEIFLPAHSEPGLYAFCKTGFDRRIPVFSSG